MFLYITDLPTDSNFSAKQVILKGGYSWNGYESNPETGWRISIRLSYKTQKVCIHAVNVKQEEWYKRLLKERNDSTQNQNRREEAKQELKKISLNDIYQGKVTCSEGY